MVYGEPFPGYVDRRSALLHAAARHGLAHGEELPAEAVRVRVGVHEAGDVGAAAFDVARGALLAAAAAEGRAVGQALFGAAVGGDCKGERMKYRKCEREEEVAVYSRERVLGGVRKIDIVGNNVRHKERFATISPCSALCVLSLLRNSEGWLLLEER